MWRKYPTSDEIGISLIRGLWPDAVPHNMDAAYENVEMNQLLFFKGMRNLFQDDSFSIVSARLLLGRNIFSMSDS